MLSHRKAPHSRQNKPDCFAASLNQSFFALILTRREQSRRPINPALLEAGLDVRVASLPRERIDSLIRKAARSVSGRRPCLRFFDYALARSAQEGALDSPSGKSATARRLGPLIAIMRDPVYPKQPRAEFAPGLASPKPFRRPPQTRSLGNLNGSGRIFQNSALATW